jgi:hypothetical protein
MIIIPYFYLHKKIEKLIKKWGKDSLNILTNLMFKIIYNFVNIEIWNWINYITYCKL